MRSSSPASSIDCASLSRHDSFTQHSEVGRLLRCEGLYSSHLTEWRSARREGSLPGLDPGHNAVRRVLST